MNIDNTINPFAGNEVSTRSAPPRDEMGKDEFLKLLSVQLQYQDPMKPLENSEFLAQMAQFSSLEGITNLGKSVDAMSGTIMGMNKMNQAALIGREVTVPGSDVSLGAEGGTELSYQLGGTAANVSVTVFDAGGMPVRTMEGRNLSAGANSFVWDGMDAEGNRAAAGTYSFTLTATADDGSEVGTGTFSRHRVDGVVFQAGRPYLSIGDKLVDASAVQEIR